MNEKSAGVGWWPSRKFLIFIQRASLEDRQKLESMWREADLGEFPVFESGMPI